MAIPSARSKGRSVVGAMRWTGAGGGHGGYRVLGWVSSSLHCCIIVNVKSNARGEGGTYLGPYAFDTREMFRFCLHRMRYCILEYCKLYDLSVISHISKKCELGIVGRGFDLLFY